MRKNTKKLIWEEALALFSVHGYGGVTVKDIAKAVGIKDSSLYKHYTSKQEIFDTILQEVSERIVNAQNRLSVPDKANAAFAYASFDADVLANMCHTLFSFYLYDDVLSRFRRMLTIEQYSNSAASGLFHEIFIDGVLEHEKQIFQVMINCGYFVENDPYIMALHFYSPLFLLLYKFDRQENRDGELKKLIGQLIDSFTKMYLKKDRADEK